MITLIALIALIVLIVPIVLIALIVLIVLTVLRYWAESEGPPNDSFVGFANEVKHKVFVLT